MVYKLPTDDDGVKYHGVVDADGDNPGQVLYGVDEHGNYRPVKVDNDGNVLTQVTGSNVEEVVLERGIYSDYTNSTTIKPPPFAKYGVLFFRIYGVTGLNPYVDARLRFRSVLTLNSLQVKIGDYEERIRSIVLLGVNNTNDVKNDAGDLKISPIISNSLRITLEFTGDFENDQGFDLEAIIQWKI